MLKKRKRHQEAFATAFEVANLNSGHIVSFHDDGVSKEGVPNQQRVAALKKLAQRDEDGDPIFALVGDLPSHCLRGDAACAEEVRKISFAARKLTDRSMANGYKTLADKLEANKAAHVAEMDGIEERRQQKVTLALPPRLQQQFESLSDILDQKARSSGAGALKAARSTP